MPIEKKDDLLVLFRVQKYRVLKKIDEGGKIPRAVEVSGCGVGSWKELTDALELTAATDQQTDERTPSINATNNSALFSDAKKPN